MADIGQLLPEDKPGGRKCKWEKREILNGIFYIVRSGCAWRLLPHDFPPWKTIYDYFRKVATPKEVVFTGNIPKNKSGKIMRRVLKAKYMGVDAGDVSTMEEF